MRAPVVCSLSLLLTLASLALAQQPSGITAQALGQANLRAGDNINSALIGEITAGTAYPVLGRSQFYPWLLLGSPGTTSLSAGYTRRWSSSAAISIRRLFPI